MFFDSNAWPPAAGGNDPPPPPRPGLNPRQERTLMRLVGLLLLVMFLGPFAGSSVVNAIVALVRAAIG